MRSLNLAVISGNLTADPEVKEITSGTKVAELRIAVNTPVKKGDEWENKANYFQVTAWAGLAEQVEKNLKKGSPIIVKGRLEWQSWDRADGEGKNSRVLIVAEQIQFVDWMASKPKREEPDVPAGEKPTVPDADKKDKDEIPF